MRPSDIHTLYIEWLQDWVNGYSLKQIAATRKINVSTLYNAFTDLRRKHGANDSVQLVGILFRKNYLK